MSYLKKRALRLSRLFIKIEGNDSYASDREHLELYTETHWPIADNSFQIRLSDIILLSDVAAILYKEGSRTGFENRHIKFTLSAGNMNFTISPDTYSIDDLNTKLKVAVLQYKQS